MPCRALPCPALPCHAMLRRYELMPKCASSYMQTLLSEGDLEEEGDVHKGSPLQEYMTDSWLTEIRAGCIHVKAIEGHVDSFGELMRLLGQRSDRRAQRCGLQRSTQLKREWEPSGTGAKLSGSDARAPKHAERSRPVPGLTKATAIVSEMTMMQ